MLTIFQQILFTIPKLSIPVFFQKKKLLKKIVFQGTRAQLNYNKNIRVFLDYSSIFFCILFLYFCSNDSKTLIHLSVLFITDFNICLRDKINRFTQAKNIYFIFKPNSFLYLYIDFLSACIYLLSLKNVLITV